MDLVNYGQRYSIVHQTFYLAKSATHVSHEHANYTGNSALYTLLIVHHSLELDEK